MRRLRPLALSLVLLASARPARAEGPEILLSDDFATMKEAWGAATDAIFVEQKRLVFKLPGGRNRIQLHPTSVGADVDVRVSVAELAGGTDSIAGIAFWASDIESCHLVGIAPTGDVVVKTFTEGERALPLGATPAPAIRKGLGAWNELRVVTRGRSLKVYVNGAETVSMRGFPLAGGTKVGLYGQAIKVPHTWAYSGFSVRRIPALDDGSAPSDPSVLLDETFETFDPGWGTPSTSAVVRDGALVLEPAAGRYQRRLYESVRFKDADVEVTLRDGAVDAHAPAGLLFWASDSENLAFAFIESGILKVGRMTDGKRKTNALVADPAIANGPSASNVLRVETRADVARVLVNGKELATISGKPPTGGGMIGLHAEASETAGRVAEFSALRVRRPQGAPGR